MHSTEPAPSAAPEGMLPSTFDVILSPSALQPASGDTLLALTAFGHGTLLWSVPQQEHLHNESDTMVIGGRT